MGLHSRAWQGIDVMVYGENSFAVEKIAESISKNSPTQELKVHSFSNYNEAHTFTKQTKTVGFIFLVEPEGGSFANGAPLWDVFMELAKPYETRGLPCLGTLIYENSRSINGHNTLNRAKNILDYLKADLFYNDLTLESALKSIWQKQIDAIEKHFIPEALQTTFISLSEEKFSEVDRVLQWRLQEIVGSKVNLSWIEEFAMQWGHILHYVKQVSPKAIEPHQSLTSICKVDDFEKILNIKDLEILSKGEQPLWVRVNALCHYLVELKNEGALETKLEEVSKTVRPFSAALLRILKSQQTAIVSVATEGQEKIQAVS